jgi:hypothetical protein
MAVILFAIGEIEIDYTPNADRQIEASSCRTTHAGEHFRSVHGVGSRIMKLVAGHDGR